MTILVFAAHPDDEVIGPGATIAKYAKKEDVIVVVFSYGDSKFWARFLKPTQETSLIDTIKTRKRETKNACDLLGVKKVIHLGLRDLCLNKQIRTRKTEERIKSIINEYNPRMIIYHSSKDNHVDHLAVNKVVTKVIFELNREVDVMTYQINAVNLLGASDSQHIIDVSDTFDLKLEAMEKYKSQKKLISLLKNLTILRAVVSGRRIGKKYAEPFFEV